MHTLDLSLYSHLKEFGGNGVSTHVNSKRKIRSTGSSEENGTYSCTAQDSEPNTLPAELFQPCTSKTNDIVVCTSTINDAIVVKVCTCLYIMDCLIGLMVKTSASRADLILACTMGIFSRLSHASDLKIGTPVAILQGAWC